MGDRTYVDTELNRVVDGRMGRDMPCHPLARVIAFGRPPALPLKASGEMGHRGWEIPSRWACDADGQWWLDNGHGGSLETCGRPDVLDAAADDPSAFDQVVSVAVADGIKDMLMLKKTLLLRAGQARAEAAALYERVAALEDAIVEKLKEQGASEYERETAAAGAESCRRMVGKLREARQ